MSLNMKIKLHEKLRAFVPFKRDSHFISFQAHGIFPTIYYHAVSINYPALSKEQISFMHIQFQVKCLYKYICKYEDLVIPKWYHDGICL